MFEPKQIAVIGGGAGGCMAAWAAAQNGACVTLFEKNQKLGKKLYLTGKGRCNVSNSASKEQFLSNVVRGSRFLYSALNSFSGEDCTAFFNTHNCPLKLERGGRLFPLSDKSSDVIKAIESALKGAGVKIITNCAVELQNIEYSNKNFSINNKNYSALIVACGGLSYPTTGSTGDGFKIACKFGHSIVQPVAGLVGIRLKESVGFLSGLSLKNVSVSASAGGKKIYNCLGEMLFTHEGISGPLVLSLSSYINRLDLSTVEISIDLKPALSHEVLDARILRDFKQFKGKLLKNSLFELLPKSLVSYIIERAGLDANKSVDHITAGERASLLNALKQLSFKPRSLEGFENAIITSGGVSLSEVNPKTMESKLKSGLYFAGENLDIDALTGGFNLQIAFSTGYLAGVSAARGVE